MSLLSTNQPTEGLPGFSGKGTSERFSSLGTKLLKFIFLISSIVTALATLFIFYSDYSSELDILNLTFEQIRKSVVSSLTKSVWEYDVNQIDNQLNGVLQINVIVEAKVLDNQNKVLYEAKRPNAARKHLEIRDFPLTYKKDQNDETLGILRVVASKEEIYERLQKKLIYIFLSQGLKTFIVSIFILIIFGQLVTKHVQKIATYLREFDLQSDENVRPLTIERKQKHKDEINLLVDSIGTMVKVILDYNKKMKEYSRDLERQVAERTQDIQKEKEKVSALLNNMRQAIFAIDSKMKVVGPVSSFSNEIFGLDIEGLSIWETIFKDLASTSEEASLFKSSLQSVFFEGDLQWMLSSDNFIKRLYFKVSEAEESKKVFSISYNPMYNSQGEVEKILMVVEDITELEKLSTQMEKQKQNEERKVQIIQEMVKNDVEDVKDYLKSAMTLVQESRALCEQLSEQPSKTTLTNMYRKLHTLKGNSRIFNFSQISQITHHAESSVTDFINGLEGPQKAPDFNANAKLREIKDRHYEIMAEIEQYSRIAKLIYNIKNEFSSKLTTDIFSLTVTLDHLVGRILQGQEFKLLKTSSDSEVFAVDHQLTQKLLSPIKRAAHILRGHLRSMNQKEISELVFKFESGLVLLDKNETYSLKKMSAEFVRPYVDLRNSLKDLILKSDMMAPHSLSSDVWKEIYVHTYRLTSLFMKNSSESTSNVAEFKNLLDHLASQSSANNLFYLKTLFGEMKNLLGNPSPNSSLASSTMQQEISQFFKRIWKYLQLISQLNFYQTLARSQADTLWNEIKNSFSHENLQKVLEKREGMEIIVVQMLKMLKDEGGAYFHSYDDLNKTLSTLIGEKNFFTEGFYHSGVYEEDYEYFLNEFKKSNSPVDLAAQLDTLSSDKHPIPSLLKTILLDKGEESIPFYHFLKVIDLIQSLYGMTAEGRSLVFGKTQSKYIPVMAHNLYRLREEMNWLKSVPGVRQGVFLAFDKLQDISVNDALSKLTKMVHEVSQVLGKKVKFHIKGQEISMGRESFTLLQDAVVHVLRNSLDHGIELPETRIGRGKSSEGHIEIELSEQKNRIDIVIRDDGNGIDTERVKEKALKLNLITSEQAKKMSEEDLVNLIFEPNFSSKDSVSDISGRGVGMDIVRNNIQKIGGEIMIHNQLGKGVEFVFCYKEQSAS